MITMLDWPGKTERRRIEPLDENDVFEAFDTAHVHPPSLAHPVKKNTNIPQSGIIKPRVLFQIADAAFRAHINNHIATSSSTRLDPSNLQLRDRNILIRGIPSPKGIIHEPLSGRRILPVDAFTNIAADKRHGTLRGELELYSAGGKGEYVGACRIDYVIYHADKENRTMKALQAHREFPPNDEGGDVQRQAKRVIKGEVLRELWALEGEVYGEKADRLVRYDKVGLPDRTEQGRRGLARRDRAARGAIEEDVVEGEDGEEAMDDMDQEVAFEQKFRRQRRPTH